LAGLGIEGKVCGGSHNAEWKPESDPLFLLRETFTREENRDSAQPQMVFQFLGKIKNGYINLHLICNGFPSMSVDISANHCLI